jgi:GNAT superfamily N-acetyltransferase
MIGKNSRTPSEAMALEIPIIEPVDATSVGYIRLSVYMHETMLNGRFAEFLQRIPFAWNYPLGVLEDLFIERDKRRRGYGRLGLRRADQAFRERGVRICILKVGWSYDEDWREAKAWKTKFYVKEGWVPLRWTFPQPVLMTKNILSTTDIRDLSC